MKKTAFLFLFLFACTALASPVDQSIIPAKADWVIHIDVSKLKTTKTFELLLGAPDLVDFKKECEKFEKTYFVNPLKDIEGVTMYGRGTKEQNAVVCIRGNVKHPKLLGFLEEYKNHKTKPYNGHTIHVIDSSDYGVFVNDNLALISQTWGALTLALDVIDGKKENIRSAGSLSFLSSVPANAFMAAAAKNMGKLALHEGGPEAAILKKTSMALFMAQENEETLYAKWALTTESAETARQLEELIRGMLAFVSLNEEEFKPLEPLVKAVKISADGATINIEFSYPVEKLYSILKTALGVVSKGKEFF